MFKSSVEFKAAVQQAVIQEDFTANELIISTQEMTANCYYACYLYVNGDVVVKNAYQANTKFILDISQYEISDRLLVKYYFFDKNLDIRASKSIDFTAARKRHFFLDQALSQYNQEMYLNLGKDFIENSNLKLGVFKEYQIDFSKDFWEDDPFNNRSWQWRLHWFEFLGYVIAYHLKMKDINSLDVGKKYIESWLDKYFLKESKFEFIWHDHATALRAEMVLLYYVYVETFAKEWCENNKPFLQRIIAFLNFSLRKLSEVDFYSKHTNHGLEQSRVLLLLGIFFNDSKARILAVNRLSSELDFSFTEEGVHKENSPGYHQFVLKVFLNIVSRFPKYALGDLEMKFSSIGTKALEFIAHILRPDGKLPIIGDTELLPATDSYANYFGNSSAYQSYLYASSLGRRGVIPENNFKIYPLSGYAIYRNRWGDKASFKNIVHLILKAGVLSQYHHQQDENNIVLYALGEDWLIDSGLYNYINNDPIRKYARSREAHNIPIISNTTYHADFKHRTNHWTLRHEIVPQKLLIIGENSVLENVLQRREVVIVDTVEEFFNFIVKDEITLLKPTTKTVSFFWHMPNDKKIICHDDRVEISSKSGSMMTMSFSPHPISIQLEKGVIEGKVVSCTSTNFGTYEDSQLVKVTYATDDFLSISTEFVLKQSKDH